MNKLKIEVTEQHIKDGRVGSCTQCPIALAVKEQVKCGEEQYVAVRFFSATICYNTKEGSRRFDKYALPDSAYYFIKRFDYGGDVKPFTFEMERSC